MQSKEYWENRYSNNGNSGAGSYGEEAIFKAKYINNVIEKYNIDSISDFGCGDGNQISLLGGFKKYYGYDFSKTAVDICTNKLPDRSMYKFEYDAKDMPASDLALSLDVTYHIVEDDLFENYMETLFSKSIKYVLIYSMDRLDETRPDMSSHLKNRKFVNWVFNKCPRFSLIETVKFTKKDNGIGFYLFEFN